MHSVLKLTKFIPAITDMSTTFGLQTTKAIHRQAVSLSVSLPMEEPVRHVNESSTHYKPVVMVCRTFVHCWPVSSVIYYL